MPKYEPIIPPELQSPEEKKLLAERERNETKLTQAKHRMKYLEHEEKGLLRKERSHRVFTRGGMLEAFLQKPLLLSNEQVYELLRTAFRQPETEKALRRMVAEAEKRITEDEDDEKTRKN